MQMRMCMRFSRMRLARAENSVTPTPTHVQCSNGKPGKIGVPGAPGKDGKDGKQGHVGHPGKDGIDRPPGDNDKDGVPGVPGLNGPPGPTVRLALPHCPAPFPCSYPSHAPPLSPRHARSFL
jgi:hypothetical protein